MKSRSKGRSYLRLATSNGRVMESFAGCPWDRRLRAMHSQQVISSELASSPASSRNNRGPGTLRDSLSLPPLGNRPDTLTDVGSHTGSGIPKRKKLLEGHNKRQNTRDSLSRQGGTTPPVTRERGGRTICPVMGSRATTPKEFREAFARRLRAARELKYEQAADFAADLGIQANTYSKYENGRSLIPHHLIPRACELLGIEIHQLFEFEKKATRKVA